MKIVIPSTVTISALNAGGIDADLDMTGAFMIKTNQIVESVLAAGVTMGSNTIIASGKTIESVDVDGSFGPKFNDQVKDMLGVAGGS